MTDLGHVKKYRRARPGQRVKRVYKRKRKRRGSTEYVGRLNY